MPQALKLSGKGSVIGQNPGELYTKRHRRGNSELLGTTLTEFAKKNYFLISWEESFR